MTDRDADMTIATPEDLDAAVREGKMTQAQADEAARQATRRQAATDGPLADSTDTVTRGGFGSGQGQSAGHSAGRSRGDS